MSAPSDNIRTVTVYLGLSVVVHLLVLLSLGRCGNYDFTAPINPLQAVMVDLTKPRVAATPVADSNDQKPSHMDEVAEDVTGESNHSPAQEEVGTPPAVPESVAVVPKSAEPVVIAKVKTDGIARTGEPAVAPKSVAPRHSAVTTEIPPPLRTAGEFLSAKSEKLSYLITLLGVPVGNVDLEAINENGEITITLRTKTNSVLSSIYPVDNVMETRHLSGNFIITKIRQQEGSFKSDIGFTILLRDKRVFWFDRTRNRVSDETIPNSEVLDILSSLYYLRNRDLQPGKTELLHIYDGDIYGVVPVEVLRQEEVRLRNLKKVDSLVLRHVKQKEIFRRTGDMMIWLTDDKNKVPVKVETTSPLGKVTIELVSAETQPFDRPEHKNSSR